MYYQLQTDEALLSLLAQSDSGAFKEIYSRYWMVVFKYAVGKVDTPEIAEDLCQDVFVSIWQRRNVLSIQNLEAYLVQAVKYGLLNHMRLKISTSKHHDEAAVCLADNETIEDSISLKNLLAAWESAISALPEKTQHVFRMSKSDHCSNREIAERLNLSEKAVEYHMTKSYKFMRLQLREYLLLLVAFLLLSR